MNSNFFDKARANMVNNQLLPNGVKNLDLIESFDNTKKELFVPDSEKELVYSDSDILISPDRYLVRTFVLAKMFEYCSFSKDDSVLVIGCLTGYSVAIISNLVSYVFGVENCKNIYFWRCGPDSNRCTRLCRPVRSLSATAPLLFNLL